MVSDPSESAAVPAMSSRKPACGRAAVLGAVLAGGRSVRYGSAKAFAHVGGERIVDRVIAAARPVVPKLVLIANDAALAAQVDLPRRADVLSDVGVLGGIHTALLWARDEQWTGVLAVACDMPFLPTPLLEAIVRLAEGSGTADVVAPESGGRRGLEPLCAYYSTRCIPAIERAAASGDRRMIGFHDQVRVVTLPFAEVRSFGDPSETFLNVNTPRDRELAERIVRARARTDERSS